MKHLYVVSQLHALATLCGIQCVETLIRSQSTNLHHDDSLQSSGKNVQIAVSSEGQLGNTGGASARLQEEHIHQLHAGRKGNVAMLFTFGAPAPKVKPGVNALSNDGCFPGMRFYTEECHWKSMWGNDCWRKRTDFAAGVTKHGHAKMALHVLWDEPKSLYGGDHELKCHQTPHDGVYRWPVKGWASPSVALHTMDVYKDRLEKRCPRGTCNDVVLERAHRAARISAFIYDLSNFAEIDRVLAETGSRLVGVADVQDVTSRTGRDKAILVQDDALVCTLAFEGTDVASLGEVLEFLSSASGYLHSWLEYIDGALIWNDLEDVVSFCAEGKDDRPEIGFAVELINILKSKQFKQNIKPKLGKCSKLYVSGHSLGGAIAELYASCLNRVAAGEQTNGWGELLGFELEIPAKLPDVREQMRKEGGNHTKQKRRKKKRMRRRRRRKRKDADRRM